MSATLGFSRLSARFAVEQKRAREVLETPRSRPNRNTCAEVSMADRFVPRARAIVTRHAVSPMETSYNGYRFRSRLEARWAMFYDLCGVPWSYEAQPLVIDGLAYLPDFEIETYGFRTIHEVKPVSDASRILAHDQTPELRLIRGAAQTAGGGCITFGDPLAIAMDEGRRVEFGDAGVAVWHLCRVYLNAAMAVRSHRFDKGGRK